jgi:myo-inositol 2-dehydrogenase / D-chiro-inositol 1-dehydrogenase
MSDPQSSSNQSRRDILKASAVIAGAAAGSFITRSAYAAGSGETIKVGLIGCGGRGTGAAGQALSTEGPVELVAVADAFHDQAENAVNGLKQKFADRPERVKVTAESMFVGFDAYKKLIDSGIDLVIIATPPGFRPIHFEYAVEKGKNIFAEKPIATDAGGVRRFLEAAKKSKEKDLKVGIGLQRHHQAPYIDTVKRIQDGALGDLILMRAYWNGTRPWVRQREKMLERKRAETKNPNATLSEMEYQMRNWYYFTWLCGDHIVEQHIHNLDVINWVKGTHPVMAQGVGGKQVDTGPDSGQIFDHHMVEFTYADGTKLLSECRHQQNTWQSVSEWAHGTKGEANISGHSFKMRDGSEWKSKAKGKDPYQQEHDDLFNAIRNSLPYNETEYGAHSTFTAIFGRMATYGGKEIKWDDALAKGVDIMPKEYAWDANPPVMPDAEGKYPVAMPGKTKVIEG